MKLTNEEITNLYEGLLRLRERSSIALPISIGFILIQDMKLLQPTYEAIIEMRDRIYLNHAKNIDKDTGRVDFKEDEIEIVNKQLKELGNVINNLELKRVPLSQLLNLSLTLDDINILYPIIEPTSE